MVNASEPLPSFDTILNSSSSAIRSQANPPSKELQSSQSSASKPTLILVPPTIKQLASNPSINVEAFEPNESIRGQAIDGRLSFRSVRTGTSIDHIGSISFLVRH
jgi:hypothetical protein